MNGEKKKPRSVTQRLLLEYNCISLNFKATVSSDYTMQGLAFVPILICGTENTRHEDMNLVVNFKSTKKIELLFIFVLANVLSMQIALAHQGENHPKPKPAEAKESSEENIQEINASYQMVVKSLLLRACGDCHSTYTKFPWYAKLPLIRNIIENDIAEAKKHLDLSKDFPFQGHGSPKEDLEAIKSVITQNTMPPWNYSIMHSSDKLTESEKEAIINWVNKSSLSLR